MANLFTKKIKRAGRPTTGKRPVLAVRVHQPLYEKIKAASAVSGLSISEETERRLEQSFSDMPSDFQVRMEKYLIYICELLEKINGNSRPVVRKAA